MKKTALLLSILILSALCLPAAALNITEKELGYISVYATSTKDITPDTATISFAVETSAPDAKTASAKNKEISNKLMAALKPLIEIDKKDTIQTKNINLRPVYTYDKNGKRHFVNYTMSNSVEVKTKNLKVVPKLIDTAIANNVTNVSELNFYLENENQYCSTLINDASSKAKAMAKTTADSLGQRLNGIKRVNVNCGSSGYSPRMYEMSNMKANTVGGVADSTPVNPGKIKINATVNADFYVK